MRRVNGIEPAGIDGVEPMHPAGEVGLGCLDVRVTKSPGRTTLLKEQRPWNVHDCRCAAGFYSSPGRWYLIAEAFFNAASVSSTVSNVVVSRELSAPPAVIASAVAAMET